ncbi:MAG: cytochrome c [Alphaproteobacteria bacterium]|nr:cytochrome c [Alphaproteobacteria bacterium]
MTRLLVFVLGWGAAVAPAVPALSQDAQTVLSDRQATMKRMGRDLESIKAYLDGKADQDKAADGAADVDNTLKNLTALFPAGTGMEQFPGKSGARPVIWTDWDKFQSAQNDAEAKAKMLLAATKGTDKAAVAAAFADLGKNGCGGCHQTFREKL